MNLLKILRCFVVIWGVIWFILSTLFITSLIIIMCFFKVDEKRIRRLPSFWAKFILKIMGCSVSVEGQKVLEKDSKYIFVSNHSSALDIPVLLAGIPYNFSWIAKKELFKIPLFGTAMSKVGYISIDRFDRKSAVNSLDEAIKSILKGRSITIFPEGTRSRDGRLLKFKLGGFFLAINSQQPIVPLAIVGANKLLPPGNFFFKPGNIKVLIGNPISTKGIGIEQKDELVSKVKGEIQKLMNGK